MCLTFGVQYNQGQPFGNQFHKSSFFVAGRITDADMFFQVPTEGLGMHWAWSKKTE